MLEEMIWGMARVRTKPGCLVYWGDAWMEWDSCHECKSGNTVQGAYPSFYPGKGLFGKEYITVFTIPVGYLLSGCAADIVFEPFMEMYNRPDSLWRIFGEGKGTGQHFCLPCLG